MNGYDIVLDETCGCGASLSVKGYGTSVRMRQASFHEQHKGHGDPTVMPSGDDNHSIVFQNLYEVVCSCGAVLACGGFLDSDARAFGRHLTAVRGVE